MPGFVTIQDRDFNIIAANQQFVDYFGKYKGLKCYQAYKRQDSKCPVCSVEKTFLDGKMHCSEEIIKPKTGVELAIVLYTSPIRDETGKVVSVIEMSTDINEIKRLQEQYHALFSEVPCYISVQDRDLKIVESNRLFKETFGDLTDTHCYKTYKHRDKPCVNCLVADTFKSGESYHTEEVVTSKKGETINVLCYTAPIRNASGEIVAVMEMSTNITELRQLQSQLSSIGIIVSSTAHDIKGLLGGLRGGN